MAAVSVSPIRPAGPRAWYGFLVSAESEGAPQEAILRAMRIIQVTPGSPAADAGLRVGDLLVEIGGVAVPGATPAALRPAMARAVGETLHVKIRRGGGPPYPVSLVGVARPRRLQDPS
jgi:C-terminal processing protease CtpA/Prc